MAANPETIVRDFLGAWPRRDLDELMSFFAADAVYHNVPVAPCVGAAAIRATFAGFLATMPGIVLDVVNLAAAGPLVMAERIDRFVMPNGHRFDLPVTGVFEVGDGKIVAFRDYFNLASFEQESGLKL
jgi:limonene-1,2-epoxide hydrolase